ncbi:MAG: secretion system protein [Dehalococcoidia bacterium]|nr:secretion system protein [Dehalococcoidia bacterium]
MDMLALAAAGTVMAAIVTGLLAFYQAAASPRGSLERRLGNLLGDSSGFDVVTAGMEGLRANRAGRVPLISSLLEGKEWTTAMAIRLESADMRLTVSEFVGLRIFVALILGLVAVVALGTGVIGLVVLLVAVVIGYAVPNMYVTFARGRRINKLNNQLSDALSLIANSLKAGFGLMQSLDLASRELDHPIATDLRRALHDINVGSSTEEALQAMALRSGSDDLDIVITAMLVQQSTGGNLAEILDNVGHTMRERVRIRGEINTLTTQQMYTGFIIGGLPVVIGILISLINPEYITPLFTETIGNVMLGGAVVLEFFGILLIRKILSIEV